MKVLVLHGPNLNLLGRRDPAQYGYQTLGEIDERLQTITTEAGVECESRQSNLEGELVAWVQEAAFGSSGRADAVVLNPGGLSHTSISLRDAVEAAVLSGTPVVEVHLTNVHGREPFRHQLLTGAVASGIVAGFGTLSYELGVGAAISLASRNEQGA